MREIMAYLLPHGKLGRNKNPFTNLIFLPLPSRSTPHNKKKGKALLEISYFRGSSDQVFESFWIESVFCSLDFYDFECP